MNVLILILCALVIAVLAGAILMKFAEDYFAALFLGVVVIALSGVGAVSYAFTVWSWMASDYEARIINREYGTSYTQEEVFFASGVINTVRELDRKRVEVNGNILTGKERAK